MVIVNNHGLIMIIFFVGMWVKDFIVIQFNKESTVNGNAWYKSFNRLDQNDFVQQSNHCIVIVSSSCFTGTPINRLPIMAKQVLDLYELYNLVLARGGLVEVINKKQWQEVIKGLGLPSSITSAAFTLRTQ